MLSLLSKIFRTFTLSATVAVTLFAMSAMGQDKCPTIDGNFMCASANGDAQWAMGVRQRFDFGAQVYSVMTEGGGVSEMIADAVEHKDSSGNGYIAYCVEGNLYTRVTTTANGVQSTTDMEWAVAENDDLMLRYQTTQSGSQTPPEMQQAICKRQLE